MKVVYTAPLLPPPGYTAIAVTTLWALFSLALFYPILVFLVFVTTAVPSSWSFYILAGALGVVCSTPWWASGHWAAFGESIVFSAWRSYFSLRIVREAPQQVSSTARPLLCFMPHGLFPLTLPMLSPSLCSVVFPECNGRLPLAAIADCMFWTPVLSPLLTWLGCISASSDSMKRALKKNPCIVVPDGIAGVYTSDRTQQQVIEHVYLEKRKGFVRLAVETGAPLVPVYCFGQARLFAVLYPRSNDAWLARLSRWMRFSFVVFRGHAWWAPGMPKRVPLLMVVGEEIPVVKGGGEEEVERAHRVFCENVKALFERHKGAAGDYTNTELRIV